MTCSICKAQLCSTLALGLVAGMAIASSLATSDVTGSWGGDHIGLVVTETGARVEYDCAAGTIDDPLDPGPDGRFEAGGEHVFERGGPRLAGEPSPEPHPAHYSGWTDGTEMHLDVTLLDTGDHVGTFRLEKGQRPRLEKCL